MVKREDMTKAELIVALGRKAKQSGHNPRGAIQIGRTVRRLGKTANNLAQLNARLNIPITLLTGRNALNPTGELHTINRPDGNTVVLQNPGQVPIDSTIVMVDTFGILTGKIQPTGITPQNKFAYIRAGITYNIKSMFTPGGGPATTVGGSILSSLVGMGIEGTANALAAATKDLGALIPRRK